MNYLGMASKKTAVKTQALPEKRTSISQSGTSEDAKRIAAAALSAVNDAALANAGRGKVEVSSLFI